MSRKTVFKSAAAVILAALFLAITGCESDAFYIRVEFIEGVPDTGTAGTPLALTGTIRPGFASSKNIVWSVKDAGTTGASISGNILNTSAVGVVTIKAIIANGIAKGKEYTQDFLINISGDISGGEIKPIAKVALTVTPPGKNDIPNTVASSADDGDYTIGAVSWSPDDNPFKGLTIYTATVTLTANEGYEFTELTAATINGNNAAVSANTGTAVIISYTFAATLDKEIIGIEIISPPTKLTYTEGDALDLSGLVVMLSFHSDEPEEVAYSNFSSYNISAVPAHETALALAHNGKPVVVSVGGYSANTNNLTVEKRIEFISSVAITVTPPGNNDIPNTVASSADGGHYTISAVSWSPDDNPFKGLTEYTATVTLTANEGYKFTELTAATVNGNNAAVSANTGTTVTISYTFAATLNKKITEITIESSQIELTYNRGETLNLSSLIVMLFFDTGEPEYVEYGAFNDYNIMTDPAHGTTLTLAHNGKPVVVTAGDHSKNIGILTVIVMEARIDSTRYATLAEAINAAENGSADEPTKIVILSNIAAGQNGNNDYAYSIPEGKNIKLTVEEGADITITASPGDFRLFSIGNASSSLTLGPIDDGKLTLSGGNAASNAKRNGVYVSNKNASFTINKGVTITGFSATNGGGVNNSNGTFTMYGGEILKNKATNFGGGVYSNNFFYMYGGKISGNETTAGNTSHGGGVYITTPSSNFSMVSGEISSNTAAGYGGGVFINEGTFTMGNGSKISGNKSIMGGGVFINNGTFTMDGGDISSGNNSTNSGGGVYLNNSGSFEMKGGKISGNTTATASGGGVYVANIGTCTFTVGKTAVINGNIRTSNSSASNVYLTDGKYIMLGTGTNAPSAGMEIHVQTASSDGVIVDGGGTEAIKGYFHADEAGKTVFCIENRLVIGLATFSSVADFTAWLAVQSPNTSATAYNVKLNVNELGENVGSALKEYPGIYVNLDLSGSTFTRIETDVFYGSVSLASITIPSSVENIKDKAFYGCTKLTSVTFAAGSDITEGNFGNIAFPENSGEAGNTLRDAYMEGGAGTYIRDENGNTWWKK
jgi:hypothetical protein